MLALSTNIQVLMDKQAISSGEAGHLPNRTYVNALSVANSKTLVPQLCHVSTGQPHEIVELP